MLQKIKIHMSNTIIKLCQKIWVNDLHIFKMINKLLYQRKKFGSTSFLQKQNDESIEVQFHRNNQMGI